eukprot:6288161-Amphidinium_carterae.1
MVASQGPERNLTNLVGWGRLVTEVVTKGGGQEFMVIPMACYFPEREFFVTVHGDDFVGADRQQKGNIGKRTQLE